MTELTNLAIKHINKIQEARITVAKKYNKRILILSIIFIILGITYLAQKPDIYRSIYRVKFISMNGASIVNLEILYKSIQNNGFLDDMLQDESILSTGLDKKNISIINSNIKLIENGLLIIHDGEEKSMISAQAYNYSKFIKKFIELKKIDYYDSLRDNQRYLSQILDKKFKDKESFSFEYIKELQSNRLKISNMNYDTLELTNYDLTKVKNYKNSYLIPLFFGLTFYIFCYIIFIIILLSIKNKK